MIFNELSKHMWKLEVRASKCKCWSFLLEINLLCGKFHEFEIRNEPTQRYHTEPPKKTAKESFWMAFQCWKLQKDQSEPRVSLILLAKMRAHVFLSSFFFFIFHQQQQLVHELAKHTFPLTCTKQSVRCEVSQIMPRVGTWANGLRQST